MLIFESILNGAFLWHVLLMMTIVESLYELQRIKDLTDIKNSEKITKI